MIVGTILLTPSDKYVDNFGNLPKRPPFDKKLLKGILRDGIVSKEGYALLPPSIKKVVVVADNPIYVDRAVTIKELANADLLIVVRSPEDFPGGKKFKLNKFMLLAKDGSLEIWRKKSKEV